MKAIVLAAGRGSRMGALTDSTPKPLLPLKGKPILEHVLEGLRAAGVDSAVVVTGYLGDRIEAYFGDGAKLGLALSYRRQPAPEGTAKAVLLAADELREGPFLLSWGDIVVPKAHYAALTSNFAAAPCAALLSVNRVDDPWRGAAVYVADDGRIERVVEKPPKGTSTTPWNNAGIFVFDPVILDYAAKLPRSERGEYELPQAFTRMIDDGLVLRALPVDGFWSDLGTPEDLAAAEKLSW